MATRVAATARQDRLAQWRESLKRAVRRSGTLAGGTALVALALATLLALASYRPSDPSLNTSAAGPVGNWMGEPGAFASDLLLSLMGPPVGLLVPLLLVLGLRLARGADAGRWLRALLLTLFGIVLLGTAAALLIGGAINGLPAGWGGGVRPFAGQPDRPGPRADRRAGRRRTVPDRHHRSGRPRRPVPRLPRTRPSR